MGNPPPSVSPAPSSPTTKPNMTTGPKDYSTLSPPPKVLNLSPTDLAIVRHALGCGTDLETGTLRLSQSTIYPAHGLPEGLYKEVVRSRVLAQYQYIISSILFNLSLILQIVLGATVTALGSRSQNNTAITVIAALNTVNAGLLALMHNSGLPERFKNDYSEFDEVEMYLRELVETGIIKDGWERDEVIVDCFERYSRAKKTVESNKPSAYIPTASSPQPGARST
ncbi:hypothetical protein B7494_g4453 [Chlorociboria aeruginascens]|nr:hypothetical protein B7494_g4453 [Chlorociboria aeruginascens]